MSTPHELASGAEHHVEHAAQSGVVDMTTTGTSTKTPGDIETGAPQPGVEELPTAAPSSKRKCVLIALLAVASVTLCILFAWRLAKNKAGAINDAETQINPTQQFESISFMHLSDIKSAPPESYTENLTEKEYFLSKAFNWRKQFLELHRDQATAPSYFVKPVMITPNVFATVDPGKPSEHQIDNTLAVPNKIYNHSDLDSEEKVQEAFTTVFECQHFYCFYSIIGHVIEDISSLTVDSVLGLDYLCKNYDEIERSMRIKRMVARLFNCYDSNSKLLTGVELLDRIFESDLYNAIVTIFAKAATSNGTDLSSSYSALATRFPVWFQSKRFDDSIETFYSFFKQFLESMQNCYYQCIDDYINLQFKNVNLTSALQIAILGNSQKFGSLGLHKEQMDKLLCQNELNTNTLSQHFTAYTIHQFNGIPVFPRTKIALLTDIVIFDKPVEPDQDN